MDEFPTDDRTPAAKDELSTDPGPAWSGVARWCALAMHIGVVTGEAWAGVQQLVWAF